MVDRDKKIRFQLNKAYILQKWVR